MQCLSNTDNSYGKYIEGEIRLIRVDLSEFRKTCTPVIVAATSVMVDDPKLSRVDDIFSMPSQDS